MNVSIKSTKLPKLFYELKIHYFSEENLNEFNFVPNDLVYSTLQDLATGVKLICSSIVGT